MSQWIMEIEQARQDAPKYVRTEYLPIHVELASRASGQREGDTAGQESTYENEVDQWLDELTNLFGKLLSLMYRFLHLAICNCSFLY